MNTPTLIVVHGPPASGKTRLSRWLAQELHLPVFSRDTYKDALFNHFDYRSDEQSMRIEDASYGLFWLSLESVMAAGDIGLIVETAFVNSGSQPKLIQLATQFDYQVVQIFCHASEPVLRQRYIDRAKTAQRHPGHKDLQKVEGQPIPLRSSFAPMDLPGPLIDVNTTDLNSVEYQHILDNLRGTLFQRQ